MLSFEWFLDGKQGFLFFLDLDLSKILVVLSIGYCSQMVDTIYTRNYSVYLAENLNKIHNFLNTFTRTAVKHNCAKMIIVKVLLLLYWPLGSILKFRKEAK